MIDTLRWDHLEAYGYSRPTSPFLSSLAGRAVLFEDASSTAPQTVPSVPSLWSGVYPRRHGNQFLHGTQSFRVERRQVPPLVPPDLPLLAEIFAERGFFTGAVVANPWLDPSTGFARGFDDYRHLIREPGAGINATAGELLDTVADRRFLLYLHYMDVHYPYEPPEPYRQQFVGDLPGKVVYHHGWKRSVAPDDVAYSRAVYDAGIRAMDDLLAELITDFESRGLLETTLVVVLGDHGEEFYEHEGLGHGHSLYAELIRVPLILVHPSLAARRVSAPVGLIDLLPTLLELTGGDARAQGPGQSLVSLIVGRNASGADGERTLFSEIGTSKAARRGDRKIIRRTGDQVPVALREQLFDLGRDPGENQPLDQADWAVQLGAELDEFVTGTSELASDYDLPIEPGLKSGLKPGSELDSKLDPELEKQLKALGYLD